MVFNPRPEDSLIIVGSDFFLTVVGNTLAKEGGNVIRFHCKDCGPDNLIIKGFEILWVFEHDVRGAFDLLNRPCKVKPRAVRHQDKRMNENYATFHLSSGQIF